MSSRKETTVFNNISTWIIENRLAGFIAGIFIIVIGVLFEANFKQSHPDSIIVFTIGHFFIILGEATFALFFLQIVIENKNAEAHQYAMSQSSEAQMSKFKIALEDLQTSYLLEAQRTTKMLRENLFMAILEGLIPYQLVDALVTSKFFDTSIIRRSALIRYNLSINGNDLIVKQESFFDIENISEKENIDYVMPIELTDNESNNYEIKKCGVKRNYESVYTLFVKNTSFEKKGDLYSLNSSIQLIPGEKVNVFQVFEFKYNIENKVTISDYYYTTHHTIKLTVEVDMIDDWDFDIIPAFPEKILPLPVRIGNKVVYKDIPFLAVGQGYSFSLKKITSQSQV